MGALYETWNPCFLLWRPFFYFSVESVNLFPSTSASILSCCVSFIHMMIYSIVFLMFLVLHIALILMFTTLKAFFENQLFVNSRKLSTILRPRAKFAITNYDLLDVSSFVSFTYYKLSYIIVSCLLLWSMYWWMWCFLSVFFYQLFTP